MTSRPLAIQPGPTSPRVASLPLADAPLVCAECGREPRDDENAVDEWRAYLDVNDDLPVFCPGAPSVSSVASEELVGAGAPYLCGELRAHGSHLLSAAILEQVREHQGDRAPLRRAA